MTRETYIRMTDATRRVFGRLPGGIRLLHVPTLVCAGIYLLALLCLMLARDLKLIRVLLVPAACFAGCTVLRPLIGRQRPYDRFSAEPVGSFVRGKGKSMPSRHTASAAAIALAVIYVFPSPAVIVCMLGLCALIAALRVLGGQHYPGDVLAALALSSIISLIGYVLI
ncbi:MAG: phosphatase PAP2 family protein [Clostridia bacterium]|nr:phosphatase PAP2 family protein [Clostridia bacterium]